MYNVKKEVSLLSEGLEDILYFNGSDSNIDFFISSLTEYNPYYSTEELENWLNEININQFFNVTQIPLTELNEWNFDKESGDLKHTSGGYFSIRGLGIETNWGKVSSWSQPIIDQREIGFLGIITKKINGILYFLLQAKAEPGNINTYQLSPTVQATRSNYMRLHGGKQTLYLEYFINHKDYELLVDQLQSEQGARFYHKRNRNIIIKIKDDEDIQLENNHRFMTLGQISKLMEKNNLVNMDTRSVLSNISFAPKNINCDDKINEHNLVNMLSSCPLISEPKAKSDAIIMVSSHPNSYSFSSFNEILMKITELKFNTELYTNIIPLNDIKGWIQTSNEIYHEKRKYFSVIGVYIEAMNREVSNWDQPIIKQEHVGLVGFITQEISGVLHFLTQLKSESGVLDLLEISPTVQCITSNYKLNDKPEYVDDLLDSNKYKILFDTSQSEEGGRFFKESNRYIISKIIESNLYNTSDNYIWMNLFQMKNFIKFNNYINIEARSLIASLPSIKYE